MIKHNSMYLPGIAYNGGRNSTTEIDAQVSVVLTTRNRAALLPDTLRSLATQNVKDPTRFEIIVVDNASADSTKQVVEEIAARSPIVIRYVYENTLGQQWAYNRGVKESAGEWIAFCDDDQLAHPDLLAILTDAAVSNDAGCVGGTTRLRFQQQEPQWLGLVCRSILGEHVFEGVTAPCDGKVLPCGGNMMVARTVFEAIGLFDTSMSVGVDTDIVVRARAAGFRIWVAPSAETYHLVPEYRLTREYLRWVSLRWGSQFAQIDWKRMGRFRTVQQCVARVGQALLVRIPMLIFAYLTNRKAELLDNICLLWRAWAYGRRCLYLMFPGIFPQTRFFRFVDFSTQEQFANKA